MAKVASTSMGKVAYEETGSGPPMVLVHSAGHDHHDFDAIVPALARDRRVIAIDLPGFGASPAPEPASSVTAAWLFDALEAFVDALDLPPAVVMGNSVGGAAAVRLAARRPEKVAALVAIDAGGFAELGLFEQPSAGCRVANGSAVTPGFGSRNTT